MPEAAHASLRMRWADFFIYHTRWCYRDGMHAHVTTFLHGATKLGARPKTTPRAIFFDHLALDIKPSLESNDPKAFELIWPGEEHHYDVYAALLYSVILGPRCSFGDFVKSAAGGIAGGCGYSESHGDWAVRMFTRQNQFHLLFMKMECVEPRGHCSARIKW